MSATALKPDPTPPFVLHHHYRRRRRCKKCRGNGRKSFGDGVKRGWDSSTLTSLKYSSLALTVLTWLLCSCVTGTGSTSTNGFVGNDEYPKFNLNDLANLMDMFPEFREYVLKTLSNYAEQQNNLQDGNAVAISMPTTTVGPYQRSIVEPTINSYSEQLYPPRKDVQEQLKLQERKTTTAVDKHGYGYDDYHPLPQPTKSYGYEDYHPLPQPSKGYGYDKGHDSSHNHGWSGWSSKPNYRPIPQPAKGYRYAKGHDHGWSSKPNYHPHHHHLQQTKGHGYDKGYDYRPPNHGWGWSPEPDHHDPHYHYQIGYELGKDVSCVLGLLGFKSWKDFTFHSIFSVLKKLKYIVLIGIAFKLGVFLSPLALPLLFPVIIIGAIIKILPLLLIIKLLFKLLKTQLKLAKFGKLKGRHENYWERDDRGDEIPPFMEGTQLSFLRKSIEEVTGTVADSESCVEKVICKIRRRQAQNVNPTVVAEDEFTAKGFPDLSSSNQLLSFLTNRVMDYVTSARQPRTTQQDNNDTALECEKIPCSIVDL